MQKYKNPFFIPLSFIPFGILVYFVLVYHVDVPIVDQWSLAPLLDKMHQGTLTLNDLWAQHNEHRVLFPQIIMLALARISGWDIKFEALTCLGLAFAIFLVLIFQLKRFNMEINWLYPAIAIIIFSLSQLENWLWGWQLQIFLNLLAVTAGFALLTAAFSWPIFLGTIVLGVIASYSFASGLLYWIIGLLIILLCTHKSPEKTYLLVVWILAALLVNGLYFIGYRTPFASPSPTLIFQYPLHFIVYLFMYLGSPLGFENAWITGFSGIIIFLFSGTYLFLLKKDRNILFFAALGLYSIMTAALSSIGRLGYGVEQALSSRYTTFANFLWISILIMLYTISNQSNLSNILKRLTIILMAVILLFIGVKSYSSTVYYSCWRQCYQPARENLKSGGNWSVVKRLYPTEPGIIQEYLPILKKHQLSVYRK